MNRNVLAAILILILGIASIGVYKLFARWAFDKKQQEATVGASDAKNKPARLTIRGAGDSYLGYGFLTSPEMQQQAASRGIGIKYTNDGGDYAQRVEKFAKGDYDFIVLPVNSYLQHGAKWNYPGVIVCSIAESRGADAIVGFTDKLPTGKVGDLNNAALKIVYTKDSPSSFLMDLSIVDFDLFYLTKTDDWRVEVEGSDKVLEKAKRHDGDVFVMWEPEVSRALREVPGLKLIHGSDRFRGYINDVFVFRRDFVTAHEEDVVTFFEAYFNTMPTYQLNRTRFIEDLRQFTESKLTPDEIDGAIKKISFYNLQANVSRQFGLKPGADGNSARGLLSCINACKNVLVKTGHMKDDALDDPSRIINSKILQQVMTRPMPAEREAAQKRDFSKLADSEWAGLTEIGLLHVEPISFQQGSATLEEDGEKRIDEIAKLIATNYPDARIVVSGHTGLGDEDENLKLSRDRANAVVQRLVTVHGMSANRFLGQGKGSSEHDTWLAEQRKRPDFNPRTVQYREPRVEFHLFMDNGF
jgi:outer membrane protein OmpA-like peptidoglycan-associated protein